MNANGGGPMCPPLVWHCMTFEKSKEIQNCHGDMAISNER